QPPGRFGALDVSDERVRGFYEKPHGDGGWINGGFFVLSPKVVDYIGSDLTVWEREPMERLAREGQLAPYVYEGFWYAMDTLRDTEAVRDVFAAQRPEIVIHMAAQPLVRRSYVDPVGTYASNVMGTVNVLDAVRQADDVRVAINVTTDKVYENREWEWGYREDE